MLGLLFLGSILGSVLFAVLKLCGLDTPMEYQTLITYPIMFIPAMMYASIKSRTAQMYSNPTEEAIYVPLDSYRPEGGKWTLALLCATATIGAAVVSDAFVKLIPTTGPIMGTFYEMIKNAMEMLTKGPVWIALLSTAVFAPFFEEWLCRGMVLRGLLQKTNPTTAIIVSSLFFALIHLNPWQAIPAFILGCLFGIVYYKTGSLKLTMLMHCVNNSFSVLLSQLPGTADKESFSDIITSPYLYGGAYCASLILVAVLLVHLRKLE